MSSVEVVKMALALSGSSNVHQGDVITSAQLSIACRPVTNKESKYFTGRQRVAKFLICSYDGATAAW